MTAADTAETLGSGSLPVLGTPRLLAWSEAATCAALHPTLPPGRTSVGTRVLLDHLVPSPVGSELTVTASQASADGRLVRFSVGARHLDGTLVGSAEITRVVVDTSRFRSRLA